MDTHGPIATLPASLDPPVPGTPASFSHPQVLRVVFGVVLCIFLAAIDQTVVIPAVPAIAADLHGFGHLSWIVAAYLLTSTAITPVYGKLSDARGRRVPLLVAICVFVAASMLCGAAQSLWQLIFARALQGLGGGGLMAMAQSAIADVVAPRERGRYQGYLAAAWAVASIAGPIVGGWTTDQFSWRWIFWANLPIGALAFLLCHRGLRVLPVRGGGGRIDVPGALLLAACTSSFLLVMSWGGTTYPWLSAPILGLAAAVPVLVALLLWHERRTADPLLPPRLFANAELVRGIAIASLATAATLGSIFLLPLVFQLLRGATASASGTLLVPYLAFTVVGAFSAGQVSRRLNRCQPVLVIGLLAAIAGCALLAALHGNGAPWVLVTAMALTGGGIGACMPTSLVMVQNAAAPGDVGVRDRQRDLPARDRRRLRQHACRGHSDCSVRRRHGGGGACAKSRPRRAAWAGRNWHAARSCNGAARPGGLVRRLRLGVRGTRRAARGGADGDARHARSAPALGRVDRCRHALGGSGRVIYRARKTF